MADAPETPDFSFALTDTPDRSLLVPVYRAILTAGPKPTVSLGPVTRDQAVAWLGRQHDRYKEGVASRSALIKNMDLAARVDLVGLSDG